MFPDICVCNEKPVEYTENTSLCTCIYLQQLQKREPLGYFGGTRFILWQTVSHPEHLVWWASPFSNEHHLHQWNKEMQPSPLIKHAWPKAKTGFYSALRRQCTAFHSSMMSIAQDGRARFRVIWLHFAGWKRRWIIHPDIQWTAASKLNTADSLVLGDPMQLVGWEM